MLTATGSSYLVISAVLLSGAASLPVNDETSVDARGPYSGYQILEVRVPLNASMSSILWDLENTYQGDVWGRPSNGMADVMIGPQHAKDVIQYLEDRQASFYVKVDNVQRLLEQSEDEGDRHHRQRRRAIPAASISRRYLRFRQIRQFLRMMKKGATEADVTVSNMGRTFNHRVTPYVTIRQRNSNITNKRVVFIEAGMHAREWIAPAMALNIIYKLAMNPDQDPDVADLLEKFDWIIIPVTNPDGYIFSQRNISTRLWRKTRSTLYAYGNRFCYGVDGNRNFGFEWTDRPEQGGSSNPCTDNFSGPQGFSEPETRNVRSLLLRLRGRTALYISLHSFGQFFLYPWGYDSNAILEDEADMREIGQEFAHVMLQKDRWYTTGSSARVLYAAAGASDDFARGGAGIKYAFTIELSPSDSSHYGFLLPSRHISTVVEDHWPAFKAIAVAVWNKLN